MFDSAAVLTVFWVYLAGVVIPGPNFVAVVHKAVAATRAEALALVAGIVTVNLVWSTCAITGLDLVFAAFPWAALGTGCETTGRGVPDVVWSTPDHQRRQASSSTEWQWLGWQRSQFLLSGHRDQHWQSQIYGVLCRRFFDGCALLRLGQHLRLKAGGCGDRFVDLVWAGCGRPVAVEDFVDVPKGPKSY